MRQRFITGTTLPYFPLSSPLKCIIHTEPVNKYKGWRWGFSRFSQARDCFQGKQIF